MRTKIHWARKSQQPDNTSWTISRENGGSILGWTSDILTADRVITYSKYESKQITDKVNSR